MHQNSLQIEKMFDRIAKRYDILNSVLSLNQDQRWRKRLVSRLSGTKDGAYLDVATGTGAVLFKAHAMRRLEGYSRLDGVDVSESMLDIARTKAAELLPKTLQPTLQKMPAEELAFPNSTFDDLSISFGLRNVSDKPKALSEFYRVLKPGGKLLILEFFSPEAGSVLAPMFKTYFHLILPQIGRLLSEKDAYKYLPESVENFYSPPELMAALKEAGFNKAHIEAKYLFGGCLLIEAEKPKLHS